MTPRRAPWLGALLLALAVGACAKTPEPEPEPEPEPASEPSEPVIQEPLTSLAVADPSELVDADLKELTRLELALAVGDGAARAAAGGDAVTEDACAGLDLVALAERTPKLTALRVSGCGDALQAGLGAFADRVRTLELADVELDEVLVGRVSQFQNLETLTLTRVKAPEGETLPSTVGRGLARVERLNLRELEKNSTLGDVLGDLPRLRHVNLEGKWAGYRAMLSLAKARKLETLGLVDTAVNNFALNQLKPLHRLREVRWTGPNVNDMSPLYLHDLPVERFSCSCARLGDAGLRHLSRIPTLKEIELLQSRVSEEGLEPLAKLPELERLTVLYRDLGSVAFESLAACPALRELTLGRAELLDPDAEHLDELVELRKLQLWFPNFGDKAASRLGALTKLEQLDLGGTAVSDVGLAALADLDRLRVLKLHHTRVTNRGLAHVGKLAGLEVLELDHTDVVDAGVEHLASLRALRELRLDHTLVTDAAIEHLTNMRRLERLNLASTVVSRDGATPLADLPELRVLTLEPRR